MMPEVKFTASAECLTLVNKGWTLNLNQFYPTTLLVLTLIYQKKKKKLEMHVSFFCLEIQFIKEWKHVKTDLITTFKRTFWICCKTYLSEKVDKLDHTPSTSWIKATRD